jgi:Rieske Fe-S protein
MYINAEEPSRSLRYCKNDNDEMILVVGENHKTGQGKDMDRHYWALADFAEKIFSVKAIPYRWSTQDCMTLDGIPYVGQFSSDTPGLYIVAGFEKWGMTNSVASAIILKDLILRGESPWQEVYNPSRKNLTGSVKHFVVENLDVAKHLIGGKIVKKTEDEKVKSGEGNIAEVDRKRTGAYRDNNGNLHLVNTTCTHMGCELNWNSAELSWDCPCHGSRFTYTGEIVEGPAVHPLSKDNDISTINKIITEDF